MYVTASGGTGSRGWKLTADGKAEKAFANKVMNNLPGGVALHAGRAFGYSDGAGWVCQDYAAGKEVWSSKDFPRGTLTVADGKLILLAAETGEVGLADASKEFEVASRFKLAPQSKTRLPKGRVGTAPVVANGRLFLRDRGHLFCFDLRP